MPELTRDQKAIQVLLLIILMVIVVALSLLFERIFVNFNMIPWVADVLSLPLAFSIAMLPITLYLERKKRNEEQPP